MPKFRVTLQDGSKYDITTEDRPERTFSVGRGLEAVAETPQKVAPMLPEIGQFAGGLVGGAAVPPHPFIGGAAGGTLGRAAGRQLQEQFEVSPQAAGAQVITPMIPGIAGLTPTQAFPEAAGFGEIGKAAPIELAFAGLGATVQGVGKFLGRGLIKGLLGPKVAERGFNRGWKTLLDPKFYQDRVPATIASKADEFFKKVSDTAGASTKRAILANNKAVSTRGLKDGVNALIPEGTPFRNITEYIDSFTDVPKNQLEILKREAKKVLAIGSKTRKVDELWEMRRGLDKVLFSRPWKQDAYDFLNKLRRVLNNPIREASPDIARNFDKYAFVKTAEGELGQKLGAIKDQATGEIYALDLEKFANTLLSTNKDETVRLLQGMDDILKADEKVIDNILDFAASETLQKGVMGLGFYRDLIASMVGGLKRGIASVAGVPQMPGVQIGARLIGRALPTLATGTTED